MASLAAPQTPQRLGFPAEAPLFVAVPAPVSGPEAVEAEPAGAVAGDVIGVAAQMARARLGRARALRLPVPAAAAPEAAHRRELEVVVEVPRVPQQPPDLVVLAVVLVVSRWESVPPLRLLSFSLCFGEAMVLVLVAGNSIDFF